MVEERRILAMCPSQKITQQDDAEVVEAALESNQTKIVSLTEKQFEKLASLLGNKTSAYGAWWVAYEEDWIEGPENLRGFADAISSFLRQDLCGEVIKILNSLLNLAETAYREDVPLIIQS